jgi:acetolactate decarboxylase
MRILFILFAAFCITVSAWAGEKGSPFNLKHYGNFKKMVHMKKVDGIVDLKTALEGKHIYGVGAIKNAEGEITVHDGKVWLNYGKDGLDKPIHEIPPGEQAALLVTAEVEKWKEVAIPKDMEENELYSFILAEAKKAGLDTNKPFPFLIEGMISKIIWHVINGTNDFNMHSHGHGGHSFLKSIVEKREDVSALLIGFYSADIQGVFTHPGESWHTHVIIKGENKAGHVEKFGVGKGSILKLPLTDR